MGYEADRSERVGAEPVRSSQRTWFGWTRPGQPRWLRRRGFAMPFAVLLPLLIAGLLAVPDTALTQTSRESRQAAAATVSGAALINCAPTGARSLVPLIARPNVYSNPTGPSLGPSLSCPEIVLGTSRSVTVGLDDAAGFTGSLALSVEGAPTGVTASFSPASVSASAPSTLLLQVARSAAAGRYDLTLRGTGGGASAGRTLTIVLVEPVIVSGTVRFDTGAGVGGAQINARTEDSQATATATTAADGTYTVELAAASMPAKILVATRYTPSGLPEVTNSRWETYTTRGAVQMGPIALPNAATARMTVTAGNATTADGSVRAAGLPSNVTGVFGRSYDPVANRDAFPGEFAERGQIPLVSAGFVWAQAQDSAGRTVQQFASPVTMRSKLPRAHWSILQDIQSGTDRIEIPIYTYNEQTQMWEDMGTGWLEDGSGTVLPEDAYSSIRSGTFTGDVFATFTTTHFSYMNVDYPHIGPWTLSRLDRNRRNNDCLFNAMKLAKAIAMSQAGRNAYTQFNVPGGDLSVELADGAGPELKNGNIGANYGEFKGNENGDRDDQFYLSDSLWNGCGDGATAEQKKNTTLLMAITIVHETSHWKWDVKHEGGNWRNPEPGGEAGNTLENTLFGGIITQDAAGNVQSNGTPVDNATRDRWLDPATWPPPPPRAAAAEPAPAPPRQPQQANSPLQITIATAASSFPLGQEIPATVTYTNTSSSPIKVLNVLFLEGYPLRFDIVKSGATVRVPFRGTRVKRNIDWSSDFATLQPGQSLQKSVNLLTDATTGGRLYNLIESGTYSIVATYSPHWGLPETRSNAITITVQVGGSVTGTVTSATTGQPIGGATVRALQGTTELTTATTATNGIYTIPELPAGSYTLEASASGYLRTTRSVTVANGATSQANFSLSPLLVRGELRFVLGWGAQPRDLDLHLWLPEQQKYHIYYSRRGNVNACPFAALDTDVTSGTGPETITIKQRINTGTYTLAVYNYSGSPDIATSQAQVQVFDSSGLATTIRIPTTQTAGQRWWKVLTLDGATGLVTEVNQIVADAAPYTDSTAGCTTSSASFVPADAIDATPKPTPTAK